MVLFLCNIRGITSSAQFQSSTPRQSWERAELSVFLLLKRDRSIDLLELQRFQRNQVHLEGTHDLFIRLTAALANILFITLHCLNCTPRFKL